MAAATATATRAAPAVPEAILLQDVESLGEQGTVVDVSKGYLRNYLIPRKLAQPATKGAVETVRQRQAADERAAREAVERAQENVQLLNRTVLTIPQQAGADGRLFGSVTAQDIAAAIREARGLRIDKRNVHLPEPIKNVGTYMVVVEVADGATATIKTMVVAEELAAGPPAPAARARGRIRAAAIGGRAQRPWPTHDPLRPVRGRDEHAFVPSGSDPPQRFLLQIARGPHRGARAAIYTRPSHGLQRRLTRQRRLRRRRREPP